MIQGTDERPDEDSLMVLKVRSGKHAYFDFTIWQESVLVINVSIHSLSQTMLKHRRINCLAHPICFIVMNKKW